MERNPDHPSEHESPEDEGIPETMGPPPGKEDTGDPQEGLLLPGDEPRATEDTGTTAEEHREGKPLDERLEEEEAEPEPGQRREAGRLVEDDVGLEDREKEEVREEAEEDREGRSAEESAVRVEEEPEGLVDGPDRYTEDG
jgi:hypothetical protein